jgi:hypothetical protein
MESIDRVVPDGVPHEIRTHPTGYVDVVRAVTNRGVAKIFIQLVSAQACDEP